MKLKGRPPSEPESSSSPYRVPIASVTWWLGSEMESWLVWPRRLEKLPATSSRGRDEVYSPSHVSKELAERRAWTVPEQLDAGFPKPSGTSLGLQAGPDLPHQAVRSPSACYGCERQRTIIEGKVRAQEKPRLRELAVWVSRRADNPNLTSSQPYHGQAGTATAWARQERYRPVNGGRRSIHLLSRASLVGGFIVA